MALRILFCHQNGAVPPTKGSLPQQPLIPSLRPSIHKAGIGNKNQLLNFQPLCPRLVLISDADKPDSSPRRANLRFVSLKIAPFPDCGRSLRLFGKAKHKIAPFLPKVLHVLLSS